MFNRKQNSIHDSGKSNSHQSVARWSRLAAATLLLGTLASPLWALQDAEPTRTGDRPDPVIKQDSKPIGAKPKKNDKKDDKKADKKTDKNTAKSNGKMMSDKKGKKGLDKSGYVAKRVVLVFPVDTNKNTTAEQLSDIITDVEKARLAATGNFGTVTFLSSLPAIRRSVTEQSLTPADVAPPYATLSKTQKLTTAAGYDAAIITSLDSYEYSADNQNVTMVLSIQMIDYSGSTPHSYTAADTVTTPAKSVKNATDITAPTEAARNLAEQLMTNVLKSAMAAKSGGTPTTGTVTPAAK